MQFANEGAEKKKQEEEVAARKRKLEDKEKWESKSTPLLFRPTSPSDIDVSHQHTPTDDWSHFRAIHRPAVLSPFATMHIAGMNKVLTV